MNKLFRAEQANEVELTSFEQLERFIKSLNCKSLSMFFGICIGSDMITVLNIDVHVAILKGRIDVLLPEHVEHC